MTVPAHCWARPSGLKPRLTERCILECSFSPTIVGGHLWLILQKKQRQVGREFVAPTQAVDERGQRPLELGQDRHPAGFP